MIRISLLILFNFSLYIISNQLLSQDFRIIDKLVLDAGHGGKDPGAVGKNAYEKDIALAITLKVGKLVSDNLKDVEVTYTRDKDVFVELFKRADIANKKKADLFISIHCNAAESKQARGTETIVMGTNRSARNLEIAKRENSAILLESDYKKNYNNFDPNSPESFIVFELFQNAYQDQSMKLAEMVQNQFTTRLNRVDRGVKDAGLLVLVNTTMPSILVEVGFISNLEEEKYLMSEQGQDYLASAIYRAFRDYKHSIESGKENMNKAEEDTSLKTEDQVDSKPTETVSASQSQIVNSQDEVCFGVQFTTRTTKVSANTFSELPQVWYYEHGGNYKYVSGKYDSFKDASKAMKTVREGEFKDAFVVAFVNGKRVSRIDAEEKQKQLKR